MDSCLNSKHTLLTIKTNAASSLSYLSSQIFYLGSLLNEPQLIRVNPIPAKEVDIPRLTNCETITPSELDAKPYGESRGIVVSSTSSYVEVLETYPNIAPICDAVLLDPNNTGQVRARYVFPDAL